MFRSAYSKYVKMWDLYKPRKIVKYTPLEEGSKGYQDVAGGIRMYQEVSGTQGPPENFPESRHQPHHCEPDHTVKHGAALHSVFDWGTED